MPSGAFGMLPLESAYAHMLDGGQRKCDALCQTVEYIYDTILLPVFMFLGLA